MFTSQFREEVRDKIISKATSDFRIVSAAVIGSYASGTVDRWSDIDLTFGIDAAYTTNTLLESWTAYIQNEFKGTVLFDVSSGSTVYRVFILPGCLQVDLSFSPAIEFGAMGPHFNLLYGHQYEKPQYPAQPNREIFGYLMHHLLRAKICSERNKFWQAEVWIAEARNYALKLACIAHGLNAYYGRGYDDLPVEIHNLFKESFVRELSGEEISRTLKIVVDGLPKISMEVKDYCLDFEETLRALGV